MIGRITTTITWRSNSESAFVAEKSAADLFGQLI